MEIQLNELIEQIKNEGVAAAEQKAAAILDEANAKAEKIVAAAKAEAKAITDNAAKENARNQKVSEEAIRQAGRNLLISFRESVNKELSAVLAENTGKAYSAENLSALVVKAVEGWTKNADAADITVFLNSDDLKALEAEVLAAFGDKAKAGVTIKPDDNFDGGFRIMQNSSGVYYDYSSAAVVEMLSAYLSPKVTLLLKEAEVK